MKRITALAAALFVAACAAKPYPSKELTVIVPYQPGGGTDLVTRAMANSLKGIVKVPVNVVNKTGGGGAIGMLEGANAKPDGYTLTTITVELVTLPHLNDIPLKKSLFKIMGMMNSAPSAITVPIDSPYNTIEDFIAAAKTKNLKVGNSGIGAIWHLAAVAFEQKAGIKLNHVPFDGAAPAIKELLGKQIDAVSVSVPEVRSQIDAKQFKMLAVMGANRHPSYPDVPTLREKGYDVVVETWRGIGMPAGTPDNIVAQIEPAIKQAMESPDFIEFMNKNGLDITYLNGADFSKKIDAENIMFQNMIGELGLKK